MIEGISDSLKNFLPKQTKKVFSPVGRCIYCGNTENLSMEHVIPFGLGGKIELPKSSCSICAEITSNFEHTCLRTMYGPLRLLYQLPSRRKKKRPKTLALKIQKTPSSEWEYTEVKQEKYPFLVLFPYFSAPHLLTKEKNPKNKGAKTSRLWIRGASPSYVYNDLLEQLVNELHIHSLMPEGKANTPEFCQMLGKIAHSFAVGELGYNNFEPYLLRSIIKNDLTDCDSFIGSLEKDEPPSEQLHEISLGNSSSGHIVVRIRLLAKLGSPTYFVVVGREKQ